LVGRHDVFGPDDTPVGGGGAAVPGGRRDAERELEREGEKENGPYPTMGRSSSGVGPSIYKEEATGGGNVHGGKLVGVGITFGQFHKDHVHSGALYVKQLQVCVCLKPRE